MVQKLQWSKRLDRIVPTMDEEIAKEFMKSLKKQGLEFKLSHKVTSTKVGKSGVDVFNGVIR